MISFKEQLPDFAGRYHGGSFMTVKPPDFGGKPYRSLDYHLRDRYGEKIYKVSLDGGMTCPNRDGTLGKCGCIFCSEGGSGDFAGDRHHTRFISRLRNRRPAFPEISGNAFYRLFSGLHQYLRSAFISGAYFYRGD